LIDPSDDSFTDSEESEDSLENVIETSLFFTFAVCGSIRLGGEPSELLAMGFEEHEDGE
jgi:hypothetical protein